MSRSERIAHSQHIFREANEILADAAKPVPDLERQFPFICECPDLDCLTAVSLTLSEYRRVRASPDRYAIALGHEATEQEWIVEETERFAIVEKTP